MENSQEKILDNLTRLWSNVYNIMTGLQESVTNKNVSQIQVEQIKEDGSTELVTINSIQSVLSSIERIDNNFKSLLNTDNVSYVINGDGSLSQVTKTTYMNNEYLNQLTVDSNCLVSYENNIKQLVFPNIKLPVTISSEIKTPIRAHIYEVFDGFDDIPDNPELVDIEYMAAQGIISLIDKYELVLNLEKEKIRVFGKFDILETSTTGTITTLQLNKSGYRTLDSTTDNMELVVGDLLASTDGNAVFSIESIHAFSRKLTLKQVSGTPMVLKVGIDKLSLQAQLTTSDNNVVGIPIQPQKKMVAFLSTQNIKSISFPSTGIKIDSSTYTVTQNGFSYTVDEYFNKYVTNIADYLTSMIKESSIPVSLGIKPNKPSLLNENFKVIQINKHLTDAKTSKQLSDLNLKKEKLKNDIAYKSKAIDTIQNDIDTRKYRSTAEKQKRQDEIINLRLEVNTLNEALLTTSRELDNNAIEFGLKDTKPKYRIIGFWDIQNPMFSPSTSPQHIIKYDIQYRYLSTNIDTVDSTSYTMINENGEEISVTVSPWNHYESEIRTKSVNINGELVWETAEPDSSEVININQLNIPINEGESVEIRLRALSEAGYPLSPLKSEWSNIIRVDFPTGLVENSISSVINRNNVDLRTQEFNNILQKSGLLKHISSEIIEADKTYFHKAEDIASGFYTPEMKNIPLSKYLQDLRNDINRLLDSSIQDQVSVEIIDFNNETFNVINNSTIELSAGNYSDNINLLDKTKYGEIIRKTGYIRIVNRNTAPIEMKTLVPGATISSTNAAKYYNVPVRMPEGLTQKPRQIIYFRNNDITGQVEDAFRLVKPHDAPTTTVVNPTYIDSGASEDAKNIVYLDETNQVKLVKLLPNAGNDFVAFSKEHPLFDTEDLTKIIPEFDRIKLMTNNLKQPKFSEEPYIIDGTTITPTGLLGFADNDKFSVGANSVGAYLYPIINNLNTISVVGNTTTSTLVIPEESEIIIPFVYEYRMTDRLGIINGDNTLTINDDVIYNKTIGVDLLINLTNYRFDINVTSKLKASVQSIESLNVSSIVSSFNNEQTETLN